MVNLRSIKVVLKRNKFKVLFTAIFLAVLTFYASKSFTRYVKFENMDLQVDGDFSCRNSVLPGKCAFYLPPLTREPKQGKRYCIFTIGCQGFIYNSGINIVILKNVIKGSLKYSPGIELYVKEYYSGLVENTVEECAASIDKVNASLKTDMACNLPKINPFDASLMALMKEKQLICKGRPISRYDDGKLTFITEGNQVNEVTYETLIRKDHDFGYGVGKEGKLTREENTVTLDEDAVRVTYSENGEKRADFHMSVIPLKEASSRSGEKPDIPLDIMVLGLDSASNSHFTRKLPKVKKLLLEDFDALIFNGYSIVGDGTTAALLAMLAGQPEEDLPEARKSKEGDFIDKWPFIFNKLHQYGYVTYFSEDHAKFASFHYRLKGFRDKPVDHWMRHFWLAASEYTGAKEFYCIGTEPGYKKRFRSIKSFYRAYPNQRKFTFSFFTIGHDDVNGLSYIQDDLHNFLGEMKSDGSLDNTFLIVMGDHGIRYGAIRKTLLGKLEERLPFLSFSMPMWFKGKYPDYFQNLQTNTERLTSPYDLHVTLLQILSSKHEKTYKHGQSLFTEISKSRTCQDAGNPEHFCPCVKWKPVDPFHKHIKQIGDETVRYINQLIKKEDLEEKCSMLSLEKVASPVIVAPNEQVQSFGGSADVDGRIVAKEAKPKGTCNYQLQVMTSPNNGMYEVTGHVTSMSPYINPEISRLDKYGDQPQCILGSHPHMRKFCFCKTK